MSQICVITSSLDDLEPVMATDFAKILGDLELTLMLLFWPNYSNLLEFCVRIEQACQEGVEVFVVIGSGLAEAMVIARNDSLARAKPIICVELNENAAIGAAMIFAVRNHDLELRLLDYFSRHSLMQPDMAVERS